MKRRTTKPEVIHLAHENGDETPVCNTRRDEFTPTTRLTPLRTTHELRDVTCKLCKRTTDFAIARQRAGLAPRVCGASGGVGVRCHLEPGHLGPHCDVHEMWPNPDSAPVVIKPIADVLAQFPVGTPAGDAGRQLKKGGAR